MIIIPTCRINEKRLLRLLPPDHRIAGVQLGAAGLIDYLIDGPLLEDENPPPKVIPIFTMETVAGVLRMTGQWRTDGPSWIVGEWPTVKAYQAEMAELDAATEPGYWMYETSGKLVPVVKRYLNGELLSREDIATMRAYLRQWIERGDWQPEDGVKALRQAIDGLQSRRSIEAWLDSALLIGIDPL